MASMLPSPADKPFSLGSASAWTRRPQETPLLDDEERQAFSSISTEKNWRLPNTNERTPLMPEIDRNEEELYWLRPCESIYSFFLFMPCVEYRRTGKRCNYIFGFALCLVLLNMVMQCGLMYVVGVDVLRKQSDTVQRLVPTATPWYQIHNHFSHGVKSKRCIGEALCVHGDDQISCGPRSVALLDNWDLLDINGDGIWSKAEAENQTHRKEVKCNFGSDPLALYGQMVSNILSESVLPQQLQTNETELRKAHIDWYMAEPLLCQHLDEDSCGNLIQKGFFDEAIRLGTSAHSQISDFQSALQYCTELLQHRCRHILPSSYHIWAKNAQAVCGVKEFSAIEYDSPDKVPNDAVNVVKYQGLAEYEKYNSWIFLGYLSALLLIFYSTMLAEWKDIYRTWLYCIQFPSLKGGANDSVQRSIVLVVTLFRTTLWLIILYGGTIFLTSTTDYLNMIFNALSLAFIVTIDELIYATMLRPPMKNEHQDLDALFLRRRKLCVSVYFLEAVMLLVIVGVAFLVAFSFQWQELRPIHEALKCLCAAEGTRCHEAMSHGKVWWDTYWAKLPVSASRHMHEFFRKAS